MRRRSIEAGARSARIRGSAAVWLAALVVLVLVGSLLLLRSTRTAGKVRGPAQDAASGARGEVPVAHDARSAERAVALPAPGRAGASAEADAAPAPPPAAEPASDAFLDVWVREATTKRPIERAQVSLRIASDRSRGPVLRRSDVEGLVRFRVPAGEDLSLSASFHKVVWRASKLDVPRLRAGEERGVELLLDFAHDRSFLGQVVDLAGAPVAGARVTVQRLGLSVGSYGTKIARHTYFEVEVDELGWFEILGNWRGRTATVRAPGRARVGLKLEGETAPGAPARIRMPQAAILEVRLTGAFQVPFRVRIHPYFPEEDVLGLRHLKDPNHVETSDADGVCVLGGLPPNTQLAPYVELLGEPFWEWANTPLELRPGETRRIEFEPRRGYVAPRRR